MISRDNRESVCERERERERLMGETENSPPNQLKRSHDYEGETRAVIIQISNLYQNDSLSSVMTFYIFYATLFWKRIGDVISDFGEPKRYKSLQ